MGVLPVMIPLLNLKHYEENDKKFIIFLATTTILTIIEISLVVFLYEETGRLFPGKICFRYLGLLTIPYIIMLLKCDKTHVKITKPIWITYIIIGIYLLMYYIYIPEHNTISMIDGYFLVVISYLDSKISFFVIILIFAMAIICAILTYLSENGKIKNLAKTYLIILVISLVLILPINFTIPIYSSNIRNAGTKLDSDYIEIAKYVGRDYKLYTYNLPIYTFYAQVISDYKKIETSEDIEINTENKKIAIILFKDANATIEGANIANIDTKYMNLYVSDGQTDIIKIIRND